ncbi:hypothetical protein GCM10010347_07530 [Streptomyces cirratus]|uniref:Uncharacterized protein n=1 Tax=Streptomyces cirratus TaxID=68187 RepID=A0ABQ3EP76_9ACTN|nr:hypothetical protein GCM10010347_07530 [Streptomyces cirratus]
MRWPGRFCRVAASGAVQRKAEGRGSYRTYSRGFDNGGGTSQRQLRERCRAGRRDPVNLSRHSTSAPQPAARRGNPRPTPRRGPATGAGAPARTRRGVSRVGRGCPVRADYRGAGGLRLAVAWAGPGRPPAATGGEGVCGGPARWGGGRRPAASPLVAGSGSGLDGAAVCVVGRRPAPAFAPRPDPARRRAPPRRWCPVPPPPQPGPHRPMLRVPRRRVGSGGGVEEARRGLIRNRGCWVGGGNG